LKNVGNVGKGNTMEIKRVKASDLDSLNLPERRKAMIIRGGLKVLAVYDNEVLKAVAFVKGRNPIGYVLRIRFDTENEIEKQEIFEMIMTEAKEHFSFVLFTSEHSFEASSSIHRVSGKGLDDELVYVYYVS